jgi:hypothetical protein
MAERKGFEPLKGYDSFNGLANRRLQPLGHLSGLKKSRLIKASANITATAKIKQTPSGQKNHFYLILDGDFCPATSWLRDATPSKSVSANPGSCPSTTFAI